MNALSRYANKKPELHDDTDTPKYSETCEIPGCETLYVGDDSTGTPRHACGKTAVLVNDFNGQKRGICADHYMQGLIDAKLAVNQQLIGRDKRLDPTLIHEYWAKLAEAEAAKELRRAQVAA